MRMRDAVTTYEPDVFEPFNTQYLPPYNFRGFTSRAYVIKPYWSILNTEYFPECPFELYPVPLIKVVEDGDPFLEYGFPQVLLHHAIQ